MKTLLLTPTPAVRRRVEPVLRSRGHDVTSCAGAAEALDAPAAGPFELVVVDLTASGLDGPEVCRRLRAAPGGEWCVVLVVTASRHTHPLAEALRLGADDYLLLVEEEWEELLNLRLTIAERKVQDNATRRRMLDTLTEGEARFRTLLETAPDAILAVNPEGRVELMNAQAERLSGYPRSELLGQPVEVLVSEAFRARHVRHRQAFFTEPGSRPVSPSRDLSLRRKDGSQVPVDISLSLQSGGGRAHAIAVIRDVTERRRIEGELRRARESAERASERIRRDLRAAAQVQRGLLPARTPCTERVRFAWEYLPCAELGGDGLNVFRLDEHAFGLYLLDVSGHGAAAALLAVSLARLLSPATDPSTLLCVPRRGGRGCRVLPPGEVACRVNRWLLANPVPDTFVTMVYGTLHTQTARFRYVSAGHPPLLRVGAGGALSAHPSTGPLLGCFGGAEFGEGELALRPGDRLFLYSDGVLEAFNHAGEPFGAERLRRRILAGLGGPLPHHVRDVLEAVGGWSQGRPQDDVSVLAADITEGRPAPPAPG